MLETNQIYNLDCLEGMKQLDDDSVDLIVSDPPYQLSATTKPSPDQSKNGSYGREVPHSRQQSRIKGFMGKEWDVLPSVEILKESLRVLKAGAFSFWLMTPRQDSQAEFITRLKQAGFNINFSPIYWAYLSGFPKAGNISKMVDKRLGAEREITGKDKSFGRHNSGVYELNKQGLEPKNEWDKYDKPATPEAKALDGSYTGLQLKPAVEVIIVAMKPLSEKSYLDQALKNKKGISWLDEVRIPYENEEDMKHNTEELDRFPDKFNKTTTQLMASENYIPDIDKTKQGRFPANLLVSDNAIDDGKIRKGRESLLGSGIENVKSANVYGEYKDIQSMRGHSDEGSLSRYFDLDKWFEERIKKLPKEARKTFPFLFVPKASSGERGVDFTKSFINIDFYLIISNGKCKEEILTQEEKLVHLQLNLVTSQLKVIKDFSIKEDYEWNTTQFGKNIMEKFQKDFVSTIKTETNWTTESRILNWLITLLTNEYTVVVRKLQEHGGNLAENVGKSKILISSINEKLELALGVKDVASKMQLKIKLNEEKQSNTHPTIKPIKLFSYLVTLGSREDDLILDPFIGSGTLGISARLTCRNFIGFEKEKEYYEIAEARIKKYKEQTKLSEYFTN